MKRLWYSLLYKPENLCTLRTENREFPILTSFLDPRDTNIVLLCCCSTWLTRFPNMGLVLDDGSIRWSAFFHKIAREMGCWRHACLRQRRVVHCIQGFGLQLFNFLPYKENFNRNLWPFPMLFMMLASDCTARLIFAYSGPQKGNVDAFLCTTIPYSALS